MAAKSRRSAPPLIEELRDRPDRFDFYQAVRLIEKHRGEDRARADAAVPLGETQYAEREAVRFSSDPGLAFPANAIRDYVPAEPHEDEPDRMTVRFMGLAGVQGPLPRPFTEWLLERIRAKDFAWRDFLDIFNHRLVSLMYRVRKTHRLGMENRPPHRTRHARYLKSLIGLGTEGLSDRMSISDAAFLRYAGLLAERNRTAAGLEGVLSEYFDVPIKVQQFVGGWFRLESYLQSRLGRGDRGNATLGKNAVLGGRAWAQDAGIELLIGPMPLERMKDFLPGGTALDRLRALTLFYIGPETDFRARFQIAEGQIPASRLGGDLRLGWTSWLSTKGVSTGDGQAVLTVRDSGPLKML